jgi:acetyltransferase-like isoleucine patch superfamily enzyme
VAAIWGRAWMRLAPLPLVGGLAVRTAQLLTPPYYGRHRLARYSPRGYTAPSAQISHTDLRRGKHTFIGDRVVIYQDAAGGPVDLGDRVHLIDETWLQTGDGGRISFAEDVYVQGRCHFAAYVGSVIVGRGVQIAAGCAFYPYDHGIRAGIPVAEQPAESRGDIVVGPDAWIGFGAIVLAGVTIGEGAVVGAGAVVTEDVPPNAIAVGSPARVVRMRE